MSYIETHPLTQSTILKIYSEKDEILVNPDYQRNGDIWNLDKRQLLIDSILNEYDIPKIYFHKFSSLEREKKGYSYSVIDGRQRLESIWKFIDGEFPLSDDFIYLKDKSVNAAGLTYSDLGKKFPKLKIKFDSISLPIVLVITEDIELIEDMFSRLNEAMPLNAAEKRNAFGGIMAKTISKVSKHDFFNKNVKFSNSRFQHKEAAAKILFLSYTLKNREKIIDTKKVFLDDFVRSFKGKRESSILWLRDETLSILDEMGKVFIVKDTLLKTMGSIPIYYLLFRDLKSRVDSFSRNILVNFHEEVSANRILAEKNISEARFEYLEYDRLSQSGSNDASSIRRRYEILKEYVQKNMLISV